jgi:flavin reductase (DIM6/NTAB) family NADH-FMN oxidoreductase RutF
MLKPNHDLAAMLRRHAIEPLVFVVSMSNKGKVNIMAAGWNIKCSYDPPMIAVALRKEGYTQKLIHENPEFVLAVPTKGQEDALEYVGSNSGLIVDKSKSNLITLDSATKVKVPIISDARLNFECKVRNIISTGDHYMIVGEVIAALYDKDKPQLFYAGRTPEGKRVYKSLKTHFHDE